MKRVLVVCYSQSGQLKNCIDSLVSPLAEDKKIRIVYFVPKPKKDYPFPWGLFSFFDALPESVLQIPPEMEPVPDYITKDKYDLIIIGYQVWFLSPALPISGFLQSPAAKILKDTPIITLCACRNMWVNTWIKMKDYIKGAGGHLIGHMVLTDPGSEFATFLTTPLWMFTGKKNIIPFLPPAGISRKDILSLKDAGKEIRKQLLAANLDSSRFVKHGETVPVFIRKYLIPEMFARIPYKVWARMIYRIGKRAPWMRIPIECIFFLSVAFLVLVILPIYLPVNIFIKLLFSKWYNKKINDFLNPFGNEQIS